MEGRREGSRGGRGRSEGRRERDGEKRRVERGKRKSARIVDLHLDCKKPPDQMRQTDR